MKNVMEKRNINRDFHVTCYISMTVSCKKKIDISKICMFPLKLIRRPCDLLELCLQLVASVCWPSKMVDTVFFFGFFFDYL